MRRWKAASLKGEEDMKIREHLGGLAILGVLSLVSAVAGYAAAPKVDRLNELSALGLELDRAVRDPATCHARLDGLQRQADGLQAAQEVVLALMAKLESE